MQNAKSADFDTLASPSQSGQHDKSQGRDSSWWYQQIRKAEDRLDQTGLSRRTGERQHQEWICEPRDPTAQRRDRLPAPEEQIVRVPPEGTNGRLRLRLVLGRPDSSFRHPILRPAPPLSEPRKCMKTGRAPAAGERSGFPLSPRLAATPESPQSARTSSCTDGPPLHR
jgi:hypothetical protein